MLSFNIVGSWSSTSLEINNAKLRKSTFNFFRDSIVYVANSLNWSIKYFSSQSVQFWAQFYTSITCIDHLSMHICKHEDERSTLFDDIVGVMLEIVTSSVQLLLTGLQARLWSGWYIRRTAARSEVWEWTNVLQLGNYFSYQTDWGRPSAGPLKWKITAKYAFSFSSTACILREWMNIGLLFGHEFTWTMAQNFSMLKNCAKVFNLLLI